jgi:iron complex outermembrane recepter protein
MLDDTRLPALLVFATVLFATSAVHAQSAPKQPSRSGADGAATGSGAPVAQVQSVAAPAAAPDATGDTGDQLQEVVVTGTLLRGIAPTGTNLISVGQPDIQASGAVSTNDLVAKIPQLSTFNTVPTGTANFGQPIIQTNIRGLGASGGTTTLTLLDGHRLVGAGILQTYADPSIIPPGVIEKVEVVPDGGSAIYGSDAIGGVVNFITRKHFEGVEVTGRYGHADDFNTADTNITAGHDWGSGSALISYAYAWHDDVLGIERGYYTNNLTAHGGPDNRATNCYPATIVANRVSYALPGLVPNTQNRCDQTDYTDIFPREQRQSVFATLNQTLSDSLSLTVQAYWSLRNTETADRNTQVLGASGTINSTNPYFQSVAGETSQTVDFAFDPAFGRSFHDPAKFASYGVTPTLTWNLPGDWQLRAMANYGRSTNETQEYLLNTSAINAGLAGTTVQTALNPYNVSATTPAVLAGIRDDRNLSDAWQEMRELRVVADGTLLTLPGGNMKLAVGSEYHYENVSPYLLDGPSSSPTTVRDYASRNIKSAYGEVFVPFIGKENALPGVQALELSASGRYDKYTDVGSTTNPKFGLNYRPITDLLIRGTWGKSFHAASLEDEGNTVDTRITLIPVSPFRVAGSPFSDFLRPTLFISGGSDLKPERATTWSLGGDWTPQSVDGLRLSATYYNVYYYNAIGLGQFFLGAPYFADPNNARFYILNPTQAQVQAEAAGIRIDNFPSIASVYSSGAAPYVLFDARRYNLGTIKQSGIDFDESYRYRSGFGVWTAEIAGSYTLQRETQSVINSPFVDNLANGTPKLHFSASLGWQLGGFGARATAYYSGGYPVLGLEPQTRVASFMPIDFFLNYDFSGGGVLKDTSLLLNLENAFNRAPPYYNANPGVPTTGAGAVSTYGRLISVGFRKKFGG